MVGRGQRAVQRVLSEGHRVLVGAPRARGRAHVVDVEARDARLVRAVVHHIQADAPGLAALARQRVALEAGLHLVEGVMGPDPLQRTLPILASMFSTAA